MTVEQPQPYAASISMSELPTSAAVIREWRVQRPAMAAANLAQGPDRILQMMLAEVREAEDETIHHTPEAVHAQAIELIDVLVILDAYIDYFKLEFQSSVIAEDKTALDGVGNWPDYYQQLAGVVAFALTKPEHNPQQFANSIWALVIARLRALQLSAGLLELTTEVRTKNEYNYRADVLAGTDSKGRGHSTQTLIEIYDRTVPLLKLARKVFGSPLPTVVSELLLKQLQDFENHDLARAQMLEIISAAVLAHDQTLATSHQISPTELSEPAYRLYQLLVDQRLTLQPTATAVLGLAKK